MNLLQWVGLAMVLLGLLQIGLGADLQRRQMAGLRHQAEEWERVAGRFEQTAQANLETARQATKALETLASPR